MAILNVEGQGSFTLNADQTQALLAWLEQNGIARTINTEGSNHPGTTLLNEDQTMPKQDQTIPKHRGTTGDGTWDLGTKWI
tara:strand:+ start:4291 stop:4533 length:243 start_codon:yes stop_codon:yes gene_type:complete